MAAKTQKPRTRKDMITYLANHFRYSTGNSWNDGSSFARNIKIRCINFPDRDAEDSAYGLLSVGEAFFGFNRILRDFDERHDHEWQIACNGRSGGYLVLYSGGKKETGHKSYCPFCGQRNFKVVPPCILKGVYSDEQKCGICGEPRVNYQFPPYTTETSFRTVGKTYPEDYAEEDTFSLKRLVDVVWDFDKTVEAAIQAFVMFCMENEAEEDTVMVAEKVMVAVPVRKHAA